MQKHSTQTPAALREGARGRSFSQRSCLPRNPRTSAAALSAAVDSAKSIGDRTSRSGGTPYAEALNSNASRSSGGSAREELLSEKLPPSHPPHRPHVSSGGGPGEGASLSEKRPPRSTSYPNSRIFGCAPGRRSRRVRRVAGVGAGSSGGGKPACVSRSRHCAATAALPLSRAAA